MEKNIVKIVLTGGPAAGKTTLISRILKEFKQDEGWRVITIPETATDLISGFGIKPFGNCMSMLEFQDYVVADQLHKERLALQAAQVVPEPNVLIVYDRALLDDKAYITDAEFEQVIAKFGLTTETAMAKYDAVIHLVTCAKGAEFAYNLGNAARTESLDAAVEMDDKTLRAWSSHPNLKIVDNAVDFEKKIRRAMREIFRVVGRPEPMDKKHKYLIAMPDMNKLVVNRGAVPFEMTQNYLVITNPRIERRIRKQKNGSEYLYFYTEKHLMEDGTMWDTERPISAKAYESYLLEAEPELQPVHKVKYRFNDKRQRFEIDVYPFSRERAVMFAYAGADEAEVVPPPEIEILREVTGDPEYKNKTLARLQRL
ncbi:MAG: AAA family ATPase [Oscillospiraceae bacterium]|nr:AAA family ATPase [Oscillospiraceae bacterium]